MRCESKGIRSMALFLFFYFALFSAVFDIRAQQPDKEERRKKETESIKDITKNNEKDMHFYGKVIDQDGVPVEKATVTYSYEYDGYKKKVTWTSKEGLFEITERGLGPLMIEMIEQEGYDKSFASNRSIKDNSTPRDYDFTKQGTYHQRHDADEKFKQPIASAPEIFKIRKKGEPTMLFTSGEEQHITFNRQDNQSYAVCLAGYVGRYPNLPMEKALSEKRRIDMVATAKFENGICKLTFEAVGAKNAGLLVNEDQLYEAPANGYETKSAVDVEDKEGNRKKVFLYIKSGDPLIYSKVELEAVRTSTGLFVKYYSWTNPYGEKGLEQGRYMSRIEETYKKLKHEAADALLKGKYAPKPDFKALEEEGKKEYLKTHKGVQ